MKIDSTNVSFTAKMKEVKLTPKDCRAVSNISSMGRQTTEKLFEIQYPKQFKLIDIKEGNIDFAMVRIVILEMLSEERIIKYICARADKILEKTEAVDFEFEPEIKDVIID